MLRPRTPLEDALWAAGILNDARQAALDKALGPIDPHMATCRTISVDTAAQALHIAYPYGANERRTIALPTKTGRFRARTSEDDQALVLITSDFQLAGDLTLALSHGICMHRNQPHYYSGAPQTGRFMADGPFAYAMLGPAAGSNYGPFDLVVRSPGHDALVIDRGLGVVHHVDLAERTVRQTLTVRPPGGTAMVQVAWVGAQLSLVDPDSGTLHRFDLHKGRPLANPSELGHLLNVAASPDGRTLYLLGTKPLFGLTAVDAETLQKKWAKPLRGEPFARNDGRQTSLALSADGRHLAVLSATHTPRPQTPLLTGMNAQDGVTRRMAPLPTTRIPLGLAFAADNPFYLDQQRIAAAVVSLGYASRNEVAAVLDSVHAPAQVVPALTLPPVAVGASDGAEAPTDLAALVGDGPWRRAAHQPAAPCTFPAVVDRLIADFLCKRFAEQVGRDLSTLTNAVPRIQAAAVAARQRLEQAAGTDVDVPDVLPQGDLHAFVGRDQVLEWLAILAQVEAARVEACSTLVESGALTVPDACPACQTPVTGQIRCPACGQATVAAGVLATVDAAMRPKDRLLPNTTDPQLFLPPGHLLVADPPRQRVVQLDPQGRIVWAVAADTDEPRLAELLQWPVDALRLADDHTLIVDRVGQRVVEVTGDGRPYWEWPTAAGRLQEPVRVARSEWGETYIVDRLAHRIWRADANGEALPGYGTGLAGSGPGELSSPADLQILPDGRSIVTDTGNHRVIELVDGQIVWQYGNVGNVAQGGAGSGPGQLQAPRRALRLDNDCTLILDAGNHRILLVDRAGVVVWQHDTAAGPPETAMARPVGLARLGPDRVACWDARCLVELDVAGTILWAGEFQQLEAHARLQVMGAGDPCRLWRVSRLADGDPERQADSGGRRQAVAMLRRAWAEGKLAVVIDRLRALSQERLAAVAERRWRIDLERVTAMAGDHRERLREAPTRQSDLRARITKVAAELPTVERARPVARAAVLRGPLPVLAPQPFASRVLHLDLDQSIRWCSDAGRLQAPEAAVLLPDGRALIADTQHHRVVEIAMVSGEIVWQTLPELALRTPKGVSRLVNGNTLIADTGNQRVLELAPDGAVVWQHVGHLLMPTACERTPQGTTLITDQGQHVVVEVTPAGDTVWTYGVPGHASRSEGFLNHPAYAVRRASGNTLICNGQSHPLLEVDPAGTTVWHHAGVGEDRLINPMYVLEQGQALWVVHDEGRRIAEIGRAGTVLWRTALETRVAADRRPGPGVSRGGPGSTG